jgi:hypothetical protein
MFKSRTSRILLMILVVAAGLRLYGLDWDEGQHAHPDERWIAMVAPTLRWPPKARDLLDPRRSTLNPLWVPDRGEVRNFAYGHLPLYLQSLGGHTVAALGRRIGAATDGAGTGWQVASAQYARELESYGQYANVNLVGRLLSVLFDLGTLYLVYRMGKAIYGEAVGLLGAALMAAAVSHIQLAHFATFDVITTFFVTLSLYGSVCVLKAAEEGRNIVWPTVWAGAAAGWAVASKFSAFPLLAVLAITQVAAALRGKRATQPARAAEPRGLYALGDLVWRTWPRIAIGFLVALLAFFVTSPFAILDAGLYAKQIMEQSGMVRGIADWPFTRQYRNTTPFVYQIVQQVRWGLGWPLGIVAFAGFGWTIVRQFRRRYVYGQVYALHAASAAALYPDGGSDDLEMERLGDWQIETADRCSPENGPRHDGYLGRAGGTLGALRRPRAHLFICPVVHARVCPDASLDPGLTLHL